MGRGLRPPPFIFFQMVKCEVLKSFSSITAHGQAGGFVELTINDATNFQSCGIVRILPDKEQNPEPMAYETAKQAIKAETATKKRGK